MNPNLPVEQEYFPAVKGFPILDHLGRPLMRRAKGLNLDPQFFFPTAAGRSITAEDIEERPYQFHTWIYACAWAIARNVSMLPLYLGEKGNPDKRIDDRWGILERFSRPNAYMTRFTFMQIAIQHLLLRHGRQYRNYENSGGQAFIICRSGAQGGDGHINLLKGEVPDALLPYDTRYIQPVTKGKGLQELVGWKFEVPGHPATREIYLPFEIIRIYQANPYNWLQGLANYTPAQIAMIQDIKADIYNTKLYDNNAVPAGLLTSDAVLKQDQRDDAMKAWYEEYGGAGNAGKIAVLGQGLKYEQIDRAPADMEYANMKEHTFEKILAAFGLNKIALGKYEKLNFATIKEGRRLLWHDTYNPFKELILEAYNSQWIYYVDPRIQLYMDTSNVEALRQDLTKPAKAAKDMVQGMQFPPALAAKLNHIPLTEEDLAKYPWLNEKPEVRGGQTTSGEETEGASRMFVRHRGVDMSNNDVISMSFIDEVLSPAEKRFITRLNRFFAGQRNRMQDRVDLWMRNATSGGSIRGAKNVNVDPNIFLLSMAEENEKLVKMLPPLVREELKLSELRLNQELGGLVEWNVTDPMVERYVANRAKDIKSVNSTTFKLAHKEISEVIAQAMKENWAVPETGRAIKDAIWDVGENRKNHSMTIARTETGIVISESRYEAFQTEGIEYHKWIPSFDEKVRQNHRIQGEEANSTVKIGIPFSPTGLMHPLDANGALDEIINCRCVAVAVEGPKVEEE